MKLPRSTARIVALCLVLLVAGLLGGFIGVAAVVLLIAAYCLFVASGNAGETPPSHRRRARLRVWLPSREFSEGAFLMRLYTNRKYPIAYAPVDADGNPATIDGSASFALVPPEAGTLRSPDSSIADEAGFDPKLTAILVIDKDYVTANGGDIGIVAVQITSTADADRSDGDRELPASGAFEFSLPEATAAQVTAGEGLPLSA